MKRKKISFWGVFGQHNLGNECTLQAILHQARRHLPDAEISCVCTAPADTSARYGLAAFPISSRYLEPASTSPAKSRQGPLARLRRFLVRIPKELLENIRALKTLGGVDLLLVPGTGFLTDASTGPLGWPYDIFKWSLMARLRRCRLRFISVGAGPIRHGLSRWLIKRALSLAEFRSYRDDSSRRYLEDIGFSTGNDPVYPDLAFNLPESILPRSVRATGERIVVGVGLMRYAGEMSREAPDEGIYRTYLGKLSQFVRWLLEHDFDVRLLIGDVLYDKTVRQDFKQLLQEQGGVAAGSTCRLIDEPIVSLQSLLAQLAETDVVVATRFHNLLLALILNKPVISIAFHPKCVSLMEAMGLPQYRQDLERLDVEKLISQFRDLLRNRQVLKATIQGKAEEFRTALDEQYALVFSDPLEGTATGRSYGAVLRR